MLENDAGMMLTEYRCGRLLCIILHSALVLCSALSYSVLVQTRADAQRCSWSVPCRAPDLIRLDHQGNQAGFRSGPVQTLMTL
jgi:hypothetical protein